MISARSSAQPRVDLIGNYQFQILGAVPINETDSLSYHMPAMAQWYQSHAFVMPGGVTGPGTDSLGERSPLSA